MIKKWLKSYIQENKKDIFITCMLIVVGICIGIGAYFLSPAYIRDELITSSKQVFEISRNETYVKTNIILNGIKADMILIFIMLLFSITLFGRLGIYLILVLKGIAISFYTLILINIFGPLWSIPVIIMLILLVNLVYLPALIYIVVCVLEINFNIFNVKMKQSNVMILCDIIKSVAIAGTLMFSSLILEQMLSFIVLKIYLKI